ncbi:hypothetical protein [Sorangium sp. So ce117]|uniref:hypothetical protein n=1 Tax=Sorangium sp. So ce117 TaxID=3133277 RepID=UPI003F5F7315
MTAPGRSRVSSPISSPHRRARQAGSTPAAIVAVALGLCAQFLGACERHADVRDEPDASVLDRDPQLDAGDIPALDSGLGTDAHPTCGERPEGECRGDVDFPCQSDDWVNRTAERCQLETGCKTNGWLEVTMGEDGCVAEIGMDEPNDDIVACLVEEFGAVRCPCTSSRITYFFGLGNTGVCTDDKPPPG